MPVCSKKLEYLDWCGFCIALRVFFNFPWRVRFIFTQQFHVALYRSVFFSVNKRYCEQFSSYFTVIYGYFTTRARFWCFQFCFPDIFSPNLSSRALRSDGDVKAVVSRFVGVLLVELRRASSTGPAFGVSAACDRVRGVGIGRQAGQDASRVLRQARVKRHTWARAMHKTMSSFDVWTEFGENARVVTKFCSHWIAISRNCIDPCARLCRRAKLRSSDENDENWFALSLDPRPARNVGKTRYL